MSTVASKLKLEIDSEYILPEVLIILEEMIRVYNDFEGKTVYVRLSSAQTNTYETRYQLYDNKENFFKAIIANCPNGCTITHE